MHAMIFGGVVDYYYDSVKRAPGAHRIASHLRKEGMDVEVVDFVQSWTTEELKDYFKLRVRNDTVFIGVSATFTVDFDSLKEFLEWTKIEYPHIPIVAGTQSYYNASYVPVDWLIVGYGELAISALVRHLTNIGTDLKYETHGSYNYIDATHNYDATRIKDFTISYEERDFIQPQEILTVELGRGCIFNCHFCTLVHRNIKGDHSRDEDNLHDEFLRNYEQWGTTSYTLSDETVNDYSEKLHRYARVVRKLPFRPNLGGYIRGDLLVSRKDDWDMLWDLGLDSHFYGIESFNNKSGRAVGKGMETVRLQDGLLEFKEHFNKKGHYRGHINLIAGLPHETLDTLRDTKKWLDEYWLPDDSTHINPLWIPTGAARKYDEVNRYAEDPAKFGYHKTTIRASNPNDEPWVDGEVPRFRGLYEGLKARDGLNQLPEPKGGGMAGMTFMNWENDETNIYEMLKFIELEFYKGPINDQPPTVFSFHNWLIDPKYTWRDMKTPQRLLELPKDLAAKFISDYKTKKFSV